MLWSFLKLFTKDDKGNLHIGNNLLRFALCFLSRERPRKAGSAHVGNWTFYDGKGYSLSQWYNLRRMEWTVFFMLLIKGFRDLLKARHDENVDEYRAAKEAGFDAELETGVWDKICGVIYYDLARTTYELECWSIPGKSMRQEMGGFSV